MVFVALTIVPLIAVAFTVMVVALEHKSFAGAGTGILKVPDVIPVKPALEKAIVAPVTAAALVAVKPLKVVVPLTAATEDVPPKVQVPAPTAAVIEAVLVVAFPYWSTIFTLGCIAKTAPFVAGAVGCVFIVNLLAAPAPIDWVTEAVLYPVALITIVFEPEDCNNVDAEGVKVICPDVTE